MSNLNLIYLENIFDLNTLNDIHPWELRLPWIKLHFWLRLLNIKITQKGKHLSWKIWNNLFLLQVTQKLVNFVRVNEHKIIVKE